MGTMKKMRTNLSQENLFPPTAQNKSIQTKKTAKEDKDRLKKQINFLPTPSNRILRNQNKKIVHIQTS